jgi:hypothetical protein
MRLWNHEDTAIWEQCLAGHIVLIGGVVRRPPPILSFGACVLFRLLGVFYDRRPDQIKVGFSRRCRPSLSMVLQPALRRDLPNHHDAVGFRREAESVVARLQTSELGRVLPITRMSALGVKSVAAFARR